MLLLFFLFLSCSKRYVNILNIFIVSDRTRVGPQHHQVRLPSFKDEQENSASVNQHGAKINFSPLLCEGARIVISAPKLVKIILVARLLH